MASSISGSNAISGLGGSDTNFDKMLEQLKKIESSQLNRLEAWKGDWNLRYEAFGQLIDQVRAASSMLGSLGDKNNFVTKNVTSSDSNILTAVANASAQDVQHSVNVKQVASNAVWANTGKVFSSKTDLINTSGTEQHFRFNYAGKDHSIKVPAGTTLDSFASMVNNSTDNPGIKVSLIQTGSGYVFQVAGKDTGAANNLVIYSSDLEGMQTSGGTQSTWLTNGVLNLGQNVTNATDYTYDLVLQNGGKKSVTIKGDATAEDLVKALNAAAGTVNASLDSNGNLVMDGVKSFSRRKSSDKPYVDAGLKVSVGSNMNAPLSAANPPEDLTFTVTLNDGNTREFTVKSDITKKQFMIQMAQATQVGDSVDIGMDSGGSWGVSLIGVASIAQTGGTDISGEYTTAPIASTGVRDTQNSHLDRADTTLTFDKTKLDKRIDGKDASKPGSPLVYTVTLADGSAIYVDTLADGTTPLTSDMTNQDLLDAIAAKMGVSEGTDVNGDPDGTLSLSNVQGIKLTSGSNGMGGFTASTTATTTLDATAFHTGADGKAYLESPPDLVYTVLGNDGTKMSLTLPSGSTMQQVVDGLKNGPWMDKDGNPITPPPDLGVELVDAEGKVWTPAAGGQPYLQMKNIQSAEGPGLKGQVATSGNWNIQRSANAIYTVDNWPMEMESASNTVSDVIDGVVFSLQDVGSARISVSTDITSVEQSIQDFLDSVNSVLLTLRELTIYDEDREVTSNDPDDIGKDNYSPSGLTNQKGGLLQGNYGVQLFKSRFSGLLSTSPPGFKGRQSADDILSGDVLASLANMGIKTDTNEKSDTYGLLVIAPKSGIGELEAMDKENYSNMITNNLEAVVDFFCASGTGSSTSADFRYSSHVEGITKAGNYEVKYSVVADASGNPVITNVTVGGVPVSRDESMPGYYYSVAKGDARGLAITIDDLTLGDHPPAGEDPMYVRIKQGLVQTVNGFLKDELVFNNVNIGANATPSELEDALALKSKNGALMSLRDNYKSIMENIDKKIEREEYRIETWEARQKQIFANLETMLKQYSEQQKSLEAQLKQLGGK